MTFSLCVYCGSRNGNDPAFLQLARETGAWIGRHGGQLVYGGGNNGLMGVMADADWSAGIKTMASVKLIKDAPAKEFYTNDMLDRALIAKIAKQ